LQNAIRITEKIMTFKYYIDHCEWENLKNTCGVKPWMRETLAELKQLASLNSKAAKRFSIHFYPPETEEETAEDDEVFVLYSVYLLEEGNEQKCSIIDWNWRNVLAMEVFPQNLEMIDEEIVASVIWGITYFGKTLVAHQRNIKEICEERKFNEPYS
jgi:hypothetical protein